MRQLLSPVSKQRTQGSLTFFLLLPTLLFPIESFLYNDYPPLGIKVGVLRSNITKFGILTDPGAFSRDETRIETGVKFSSKVRRAPGNKPLTDEFQRELSFFYPITKPHTVKSDRHFISITFLI